MPRSRDAPSSDSRPSPALRRSASPTQRAPVAAPAPAAAQTARGWCLQMRPRASSRRADARQTLPNSKALAFCRASCAPPAADPRLSSPGTKETPLTEKAPLRLSSCPRSGSPERHRRQRGGGRVARCVQSSRGGQRHRRGRGNYVPAPFPPPRPTAPFPSFVSVPMLSRRRDAAPSSWSRHADRRQTVNRYVYVPSGAPDISAPGALLLI